MFPIKVKAKIQPEKKKNHPRPRPHLQLIDFTEMEPLSRLLYFSLVLSPLINCLTGLPEDLLCLVFLAGIQDIDVPLKELTEQLHDPRKSDFPVPCV